MASSFGLGLIVTVLTFVSGVLVLLGLTQGGYYAVALGIAGQKAAPALQPHLVNGALLAGAGVCLLVAALRVRR